MNQDYSDQCLFVQLCSSAVDTKQHITVAIKRLKRPFLSAEHAKRAYREIHMLKHMKNENVGIIFFCILFGIFIW